MAAASGISVDRVTATGVLVYDGDPHTDEWFAVRRAGITATDLPAILGLSEYRTARGVWLDKQDLAPADDGGEAAMWGTILENPVAREWARRNSVDVAAVGVLAHVEHPWRLASLDRIPSVCPDGDGPCGLEVKTRSAFVAGRWRDDIPDDVLAQVQWGLHVTGLDHMHVACLIGGQRLTEYRIDPDDAVTGLLIEEAERIWGDVQAGTVPVEDPTPALGRLLDAVHQVRDGDAVVDASKADALLADYIDACAAERSAKSWKERARVAVVDALGPAERLIADDEGGPRLAFTYKAQSRAGISVEAARKSALWQQIQAAGLVKTSTFRVLKAHRED